MNAVERAVPTRKLTAASHWRNQLGFLPLVVAIGASLTGRKRLKVLDARWDDFVYWLQGLF